MQYDFGIVEFCSPKTFFYDNFIFVLICLIWYLLFLYILTLVLIKNME